jgi:ParB family chromosome partitioning protein
MPTTDSRNTAGVGSAIVVGARKFVFSNTAQSSPRIAWWGAQEDRSEFAPRELRMIFMHENLGRADTVRKFADRHKVEIIEFRNEKEIFSELSALTGVEVDPEPKTEVTIKPVKPEPVAPKTESTPTPTSELRSGNSSEEPEPTLAVELEVDDSDDEVQKDFLLADDRIVNVPVDKIHPNPNQPRKFFDKKKLAALGKSLLGGQRLPVILVVIEDQEGHYMLCDGERRWKAAKNVGKPTIRAIIAQSMTEAELFMNSAICNFGREGHTHMEIARGLQKMKRDNHLTIQQLADDCAMSTNEVSLHFNLLRLSPEVSKLVDPELPEEQGLAFLSAVEVSKFAPEKQPEVAQYIISHKMTVSQVRHYVRHELAKLGHTGGRKRTACDDLKILHTFIRATKEKAGQLLDLPGGITLDSLFANRSWTEVDLALRELDYLSGQIKRIRAQIAKADDQKKTA